VSIDVETGKRLFTPSVLVSCPEADCITCSAFKASEGRLSAKMRARNGGQTLPSEKDEPKRTLGDIYRAALSSFILSSSARDAGLSHA
jgi:hypothetical protein